MANANIMELMGEQLRASIEGTDWLFVDFWAPWCGPCRMVAPAIEQIAGELAPALKVAKVNIDDDPDSAKAHGVASIPTMILFHKGKEVERIIGAQSKAQLVATIEKHVALR